jgi:hypothetical protein
MAIASKNVNLNTSEMMIQDLAFLVILHALPVIAKKTPVVKNVQLEAIYMKRNVLLHVQMAITETHRHRLVRNA